MGQNWSVGANWNRWRAAGRAGAWRMATDKWDEELMERGGGGEEEARGRRRRGAQPGKTRLPDLGLQPEREQKWADLCP